MPAYDCDTPVSAARDVVCLLPFNTFSSNNLKLTFSIWVQQSLTLLWGNFGHCFGSVRLAAICLSTALLRQHFDQVEVWTLNGPLQQPDWLLCFGSLSCCVINFQRSFRTFDSRTPWCTEAFVFTSVTAVLCILVKHLCFGVLGSRSLLPVESEM